MNKHKALWGLIIIFALTICLQNNIMAASEDDIESIIKQYQQETRCEHVSAVVFDNGEISYYTTENPERFKEQAQIFLHQPIEVENITLV